MEIEPAQTAVAKPKVYKQRFLVLFSYMLTYFLWNWWSTRHVIIARTYAKYHDSEVSVPGIDILTIVSNIFVFVSYPFAAYFIDRFGLRMMIVGNGFLTLSTWIWYAAKTDLNWVIVAQSIGSLFGSVTSVAILAVSNRWFPENERSRATAAGSVLGLLGAGFGLVGATFFYSEDERVVDTSLKDCIESELSDELLANLTQKEANDEFLFCPTGDNELDALNDAFDAGCCYQPADVEGYNLVMAILQTLAFIFSAAVVKNVPPSPPSYSAEDRGLSTNMLNAFKRLLTNKQIIWISITDLFVTGPPTVLFANIERILPARVSELSIVMGAAGLGLAIPGCALFGYALDKYRAYYSMTFAAYILATCIWLIACIGYTAGGMGGALVVVVAGTLGVLIYVGWQVSEYELKLEWAFQEDINIEGATAGLDRMVINLSSIIFISAIPPEQFAGLSSSRAGGFYTFWFGLIALVIGVSIFFFTPDRYNYRRRAYELASTESGKQLAENPHHHRGSEKRMSFSLSSAVRA